jgi:hypothetical protein
MLNQVKTKNKDMEDNSILEVLTQLESDLKDIKAAKEQIDDVLDADSEINENLADYSQQLASIATQLGSLKELIKSEVKGIVSDVDSDVTERLVSVGKLVSNIGKLSSEIESNAKKAVSNTTEAMNDSCSKVIKSFEYSTKNTSEAFSKQTSAGVDKLVQAATDLKGSASDFSGSKKEILQKIDTLAGDLSSLNTVANSIEKAVLGLVSESTQQTKNLQTANENINQVLTNFKSHDASLQSAVKAIEEKNDKAKDELKGAIDTNKKILFGVIFLVVVDIILRFV